MSRLLDFPQPSFQLDHYFSYVKAVPPRTLSPSSNIISSSGIFLILGRLLVFLILLYSTAIPISWRCVEVLLKFLLYIQGELVFMSEIKSPGLNPPVGIRYSTILNFLGLSSVRTAIRIVQHMCRVWAQYHTTDSWQVLLLSSIYKQRICRSAQFLALQH